MLGGPGSTMGGRRGCAERCGGAETGGGRGEQRGAAAAPPFISSRGRPRPVPSRSAPRGGAARPGCAGGMRCAPRPGWGGGAGGAPERARGARREGRGVTESFRVEDTLKIECNHNPTLARNHVRKNLVYTPLKHFQGW